MLRILVMLLAFSGCLYAADPQIESISDREFAFDLDGSRISIEIRKLTDNRKSLRDALRGVLDAGLSMHADTTAMEVFEVGDRATGVDVLLPLYQKMKADPYPVDLAALWQTLGVTLENQQVVYNDQAPMAHIRKRLLKS